MLLAIDIGNTNISLAVFANNRLIRRYTIPTKERRYFKKIRTILSQYEIKDAIICSVVPNVTNIFQRYLRKWLGEPIYIIGKNIKVPIKNLYRKPRQVGCDRLVNAYAGIMFYSAPLIVIDFGTAITFDVISKDKEYLGGMILPGLGISLDALFERTALLPKVKLSRPQEFIGRDTKNSMLSGIVYGFSVLADSLAMKIKGKIGRNTKIIGTGGNINLLGKYCQKIDKIDADLTLKGLNLIYRNFLDSVAHCRRIKENFH